VLLCLTSATLLCAHGCHYTTGRSFGSAAHQQQPTAAAMLAGGAGGGEDPFLQNVLDTVHKASGRATAPANSSTASTTTTIIASGTASATAAAGAGAATAANQDVYGESWEEYRAHVAATSGTGASPLRNGKMHHKHHQQHHHKGHNNTGHSSSEQQQHAVVAMGTVLDAEHPSFERQDKAVYGAGGGSRIYPAPDAFPEAREYMAWRLKRNRRRLQRLDRAATKIQVRRRVTLLCVYLCVCATCVVCL
jgi:hypothetical protein